MDAAHDNRRQLGQLMVDEGIVTSDQLTDALAEQDRTGRPLGEILVELGFASPGAVANALAEQHGGLLKTEYGVSAGLRAVTDAGLANAPVRPVLPSPEDRAAPKSEAPEEPVPPLRVIVADPPADDGPPVAPTPAVPVPDEPAQIPNAEEMRIADLSSRLDDAVSKLRVSQQARDAFSKRVTELEAQLASGGAPEADPAQAARIAQLEAHIQQLDAHIQAAAADRENIVQHYTQLQAQLAAAQAAAAEPAATEPDPAQVARIEELEAQLQAAAVERQSLVDSLSELQARLGETSEARGAELAEASAGAAAHVSVLEGQLKDATRDRGVLEQRVSELQGALLASEQARAGEIQTANAEALGRISELELHLKQAELNLAAAQSESEGAPESGRVAELEAQLQAMTEERDAVLAGLAEHDEARAEEIRNAGAEASARIAELEEQLSAAQTETAGAPDTGRVAELEAQLQAVAEERDAILAGLAEHDATSTRLREDIAERDRQLAENVNEIARLNREHRAELDRLSAAAQSEGDAPDPGRVTELEAELAERDRELAENGVILASIAEQHATLERLRAELADRERQLAEHAEQDAAMNGLREGLSDLDRRLAEHDATISGLREDLADRDRQLAAQVPDEPAIEDEPAHVLFIPTPSGYTLHARTGPPPAIGVEVEVEGDAEGAGRFVVRKHGRPLPGGPCYAYVERV